MGDHLYTATEAADYLNVKPRTVLDWAKDRKIGCVRTGPHAKFVRFKREHLEAFVDANELPPKG